MAYFPDILSRDDYDSIRALLGITKNELSDLEIEQAGYLPYVEAQVKNSVTDYASLTGDDETFLKVGIECWTAALLCRFLHGKAVAGTFAIDSGGFKLGDYEEKGSGSTIVKLDFLQRAKELADQAVEALGSISTRSFTPVSYLLLAGPTRSGATAPTTTQEWLDKIVPEVVKWADEEG